MKIRTDFVTNSSSSSFIVQITFTDCEGRQYSALIPDDDEDGVVNANISCAASEVAKVESIDNLMELLSDSLVDENGEHGEELGGALYGFCQRVRNEIGDIQRLKSIEFKRIWSAWGEFSTCFLPNLGPGQELFDLSKIVCDSKGEAKEAAKKSLSDYLTKSDFTLSEPDWPTHFMGTNPSATIDYSKLTADIEVFATMVVSGALPDTDFGEEVVTIDIDSESVESSAAYIPGGDDSFFKELLIIRYLYGEEINADVRTEVEEWIRQGNSPYENPWDIYTEIGYPADYLTAKRMRGEL